MKQIRVHANHYLFSLFFSFQFGMLHFFCIAVLANENYNSKTIIVVIFFY